MSQLADFYQLHVVFDEETASGPAAALLAAIRHPPWPAPARWRSPVGEGDEGWKDEELEELPDLDDRASLQWGVRGIYGAVVYMADAWPVATVTVEETEPERAWRWLRAMEEVLERLLRDEDISVHHGVVRRSGGGVACIPRVPVAHKTSYVLATTDELLAEGYDDIEAMIADGEWQAREIGAHRLLSRAMHAETNVELLEAIQDGHWAMARLARPGLTRYDFQDPRPEEVPIFQDGERRVLAVGYIEDDQAATYSCALKDGEHVQPWEIWYLGKAKRAGKLPTGEAVKELRVVFSDRESAMRERRPLMDVGVTVQCYDEGGELITLPKGS